MMMKFTTSVLTLLTLFSNLIQMPRSHLIFRLSRFLRPRSPPRPSFFRSKSSEQENKNSSPPSSSQQQETQPEIPSSNHPNEKTSYSVEHHSPSSAVQNETLQDDAHSGVVKHDTPAKVEEAVFTVGETDALVNDKDASLACSEDVLSGTVENNATTNGENCMPTIEEIVTPINDEGAATTHIEVATPTTSTVALPTSDEIALPIPGGNVTPTAREVPLSTTAKNATPSTSEIAMSITGERATTTTCKEDTPAPLERPLPMTTVQTQPSRQSICKPVAAADVLSFVLARDSCRETPVLTYLLPGKVQENENLDLMGVQQVQEAVILARTKVLDAMFEDLVWDEGVQQVVMFGRGSRVVGRTRMRKGSFAYEVRDVVEGFGEDDDWFGESLKEIGLGYGRIEGVLEGCVWDSGVVMGGFKWTEKSVWVVELDVWSGAGFERGLKMMGRLGGRVLAVFGNGEYWKRVGEGEDGWIGGGEGVVWEDVFEIGRRCGMVVEFMTSLRDGMGRFGVGGKIRELLRGCEIAEGVRFVVFRGNGDGDGGGMEVDEESDVTMERRSIVGCGGVSVNSLVEFEEYVKGEMKGAKFELEAGSLPAEYRGGIGWQFWVVVIGSEVGLGCWDARRARKMKAGGTGELFEVEVFLNVEVGVVEFKYAVVNERGEIVSWEGGGNRVLKSGDQRYWGRERVRDFWRNAN